jgi:hypothetical protein
LTVTVLPLAIAAVSWFGPVGTTPHDQLPPSAQLPVAGCQVQALAASADPVGAADRSMRAASASELRANGLRGVGMVILLWVAATDKRAGREPQERQRP